jgi:hypothetical protein
MGLGYDEFVGSEKEPITKEWTEERLNEAGKRAGDYW